MEKWIIVNQKTGEIKEGIYASIGKAYDSEIFDGSESMNLDVVPEGSVFVESDVRWIWAWPDTPHHPDW